MNRDALPAFFEAHQIDGLISLATAEQAAQASGLTLYDVEDMALASGFLPKRYQRNRTLFSIADQLTLHRSRVALVGCGGLGGHSAEMLARCGVGCFTCIDPDSFAEHNLNRQRFCTISSLGRPKAEVIAEELADINPATQVDAHVEAFRFDCASDLLGGARIVLDGLDSFDVRSELASACGALSVPFIHGAIGGWYGQFGTQSADSDVLAQWLNSACGKVGLESELGNPSFTPPFIAALQAAAAVKILLSKDDVFWGKLFFCDLRRMSFDAGSLG